MSFLTEIKSQAENLWVFRPFFPVLKVIRDAITFPIDYYFGDGRSRALPSIVNLNVTTICNLNCPFCFNHDILGKRNNEMSLQELTSLLDQLARNRVGLFLTGGEPFARKDIYEIIEEAKRRKLPVGVVTNGTLLCEDDVVRLRRIGLDVVVISFHGTRDVHDETVGKPGAYDKTMATLDLFRKHWPAPGPMINYIATEKSVACLDAFLDEIRHKKNVMRRLSHLNFITPAEAAANGGYWKKHFGREPEKVLHYVCDAPGEIDEALMDILGRGKNANVFTKPFLTRREAKMWYSDSFDIKRRCVFVWRSAFIDSDGEVYPCQYLYLKMGNVKEKSLDEIWSSGEYRRFRAFIREGLTPACSRCCKL